MTDQGPPRPPAPGPAEPGMEGGLGAGGDAVEPARIPGRTYVLLAVALVAVYALFAALAVLSR